MIIQIAEHKWVDTQMTNYKMELKRLQQEELTKNYDDIEFINIKDKSTEYYLNLWYSVGKAYNWSSRLRLTEQEIRQRVFEDPSVIVYEIRHQGNVIGISEYKLISNGEYATSQEEVYAEIMFFGLTEDNQGKGFGKKSFLKTIKDIKENKKIERIILQTCQLDSVAALPFYQKCGFDIFKTWNEMERIIFYN